MHRQRLILAILALLGTAICFVPYGRTPVLGPMNEAGLVQIAALVLGLSVLVSSLAGPLARGISGAARVVAPIFTILIFAAAVMRVVLQGYYWIPQFAENDPRAADFYERACKAGRTKACLLLGTCFWTETCGQSKDVGRAVELYEVACAASEIGACGQLGVCYELGGCGVPRSGSKAIAMYEKACNGGEMDMCNNLGVCYHRGECGVFRDSKRARAYYGKACDGGYSGACHNLTLLKD